MSVGDSNPDRFKVSIISFFIGLAALSVGVSIFQYYCVLRGWNKQSDANLEVFKSALQVFTVGVIGSSVTLLGSLYNAGRQKADADKREALQQADADKRAARQQADLKATIQQDFAHRLTKCFLDTKKVRRHLIVQALDKESAGGPSVLHKNYDKLMEDLMDVELALEDLWHQVGGHNFEHPSHLFVQEQVINKKIDTMKNYARKLMDVYERKKEIFKNRNDKSPLSEFCANGKAGEYCLSDFTDEPHDLNRTPVDTSFYKDFIIQYREAIYTIRKEILPK